MHEAQHRQQIAHLRNLQQADAGYFERNAALPQPIHHIVAMAMLPVDHGKVAPPPARLVHALNLLDHVRSFAALANATAHAHRWHRFRLGSSTRMESAEPAPTSRHPAAPGS